MSTLHEAIDGARERAGFLTLAATVALIERGNVLLDPYSTLISARAEIGGGNTFYPGAVVECGPGSTCRIGNGNVLHGTTVVEAVNGGYVSLGDGNLLGGSSVQVKANQPSAHITIGNRARLLNGVELVGVCDIGDGAQILGAINAQSVTLAGGGDYTSADPDARGAVLKGNGLARGLKLAVGDVVNGNGDFSAAPIERQSAYHPKARR